MLVPNSAYRVMETISASYKAPGYDTDTVTDVVRVQFVFIYEVPLDCLFAGSQELTGIDCLAWCLL